MSNLFQHILEVGMYKIRNVFKDIIHYVVLLTVCYVHSHWIALKVNFNIKQFSLKNNSNKIIGFDLKIVLLDLHIGWSCCFLAYMHCPWPPGTHLRR